MHLILLAQGSSSVSAPSSESKERLLMMFKTDNRTESIAVCPRAFNLVFFSTSTAEEAEAAVSASSSRLKEKDLRTKQGAPGPPKRIMAPRRTLCGITTPPLGGEVIRTPFT